MAVANIGEFDSIFPDGLGTMMAITPAPYTFHRSNITSAEEIRRDEVRFWPGTSPVVRTRRETAGHFRICNLDRSREVSAVIRTVLTLADTIPARRSRRRRHRALKP